MVVELTPIEKKFLKYLLEDKVKEYAKSNMQVEAWAVIKDTVTSIKDKLGLEN